MKFTQILGKIKGFFKSPIRQGLYTYKNLVKDSEKIEISPSGKYKLVVAKYAATKGCWHYSRGTVSEVGGEIISDVKRNYSHFPFAWVENHPNGHDHLVCGENYQGQTIVELDTGKRLDHLPKEAKKGFAFCWTAIHPSPNKLTLAVEGCFWACPYEVIFVDFSNPMQAPNPLEHQPSCDYSDFFSWNTDGTANIGHERERRKSDGKWASELTDEEENKMYDEEDWEDIPIETVWRLDGSGVNLKL